MEAQWANELAVAITVTDKDGNIIEMNNRSAEVFAKYGGFELIGKKLNDCHKPSSQTIISKLEQEKATNVYSIEKNGVKKLIYQGPWFKNGEFAGLVELSMVIPENLPHFVR
ncbi:MAG: diguanylate cyclase [Bacteroidetes bacterium HGW-Bacteroidetes-9]|nr:MAG: diguanylate cyclase [Bacteroidetes bacterium HGW-Bacteroidetes-9]